MKQMYQTSARNTFFGHIKQIRKTPIVTEVVLLLRDDFELVSVITTESFERLAVAEGAAMTAMVKAPDVLLAMDLSRQAGFSARNRLHGQVDTVTSRGVAVEVRGILHNGTPMCAMCTARSVEDLGLKAGDGVLFVFTAFSLILAAS
jgi:molybdate transport system regulatory protein